MTSQTEVNQKSLAVFTYFERIHKDITIILVKYQLNKIDQVLF